MIDNPEIAARYLLSILERYYCVLQDPDRQGIADLIEYFYFLQGKEH